MISINIVRSLNRDYKSRLQTRANKQTNNSSIKKGQERSFKERDNIPPKKKQKFRQY